MARTIHLDGHVGPEGFINLLEAMGFELTEHETRVQERGLAFKQTNQTWSLRANTVFVELRHDVVEVGSPGQTAEDWLWAVVHTSH